MSKRSLPLVPGRVLFVALLAAALAASLALTSCAPAGSRSAADASRSPGDQHDDHAAHDDDGHGDDHGEDHGDDQDGDHDDHGGDRDDHGAESVDAGRDDHDSEEGLRLTAEQADRSGVEVRRAGPGTLASEVTLRGEVTFNEDRLVHVSPRVAGMVRDVRHTVGDRVKAGEILVILDSRELADARAELVAARGRAALAERTFERESALHERQVSSEQDYLDAQQALEEARLGTWAAEQRLRALGLSSQMVRELAAAGSGSLTQYELRSPIDGVVTERHVSLGESLEERDHVLTVADTSSVWVSLTVYTKDLAAVRVGARVLVKPEHGAVEAESEIAMVTPFVEAATRSATARVVLDDAEGRWIPGTFVTGVLRVTEEDLPIVVPRDAVQTVDGREVVFVDEDGAFHPAPVTVGRSDSTHVEILAGLPAGTPYVAAGAFALKATLATSALGSHAGHGH